MTHSLDLRFCSTMTQMRSHGLSCESSPYLEWDCEGTGSKLQRVPQALRFGLQLVVDQMLQTLESCSVCRALNMYMLETVCGAVRRLYKISNWALNGITIVIIHRIFACDPEALIKVIN